MVIRLRSLVLPIPRRPPTLTARGTKAPENSRQDGGGTFKVLYVPLFGKNYARPISERVGSDVLDHLGIGHYPETKLTGEQGNFAVAAHRQTHGQVFWDSDKLVDGDYLYVQTSEGYYSYRTNLRSRPPTPC